ncbi:class GN sortase [Brevundimonas sp.]|uniref:class GN sortase n=1 Tax=Brevundimonas sp. TaxID=1871086 RepID=UPI002D3D23E7|nr:class GN sortase [Brevundimonas sp.]HYC73482.1 class GN sortase [Brevundimonas sp.]
MTGLIAGKGGRAAGRVFRLPLILAVVAGLGLIGHGLFVPVKAAVAQVLLERAFDRARDTGRPVKAWPWADTAPTARISVPRLGVSQIVLAGGSGEALAFGPTLLPGGAEPGRRGTAVFAAHRDTHFRFLKDLRRDDLIVVETIAGGRSEFRVSGGAVVRRDRFGVDRYASQPSIALTTCWPFDAPERGPWRFIVSARRV